MSAAEVGRRAQRERPRLLDFIRRRVASPEDAEDILQDVFYSLLAGYSVTEPIEKLGAWLFRAARNRIIDWYRTRKQQVGLAGEKGEEVVPRALEELMADPAQAPDSVYVRSLVWEALSDALDELPEEQRQVFLWHELEGRSFQEIARLTGSPVSTLLSRKRYAVLHLRERLQDLYDDIVTGQ